MAYGAPMAQMRDLRISFNALPLTYRKSPLQTGTMAKEGQRNARDRTWKVLRAPPPREWVGTTDSRTAQPTEISVLLAQTEISGLLGTELQLVLRELRTRAQTPAGTTPKRKRGALHVAERRGEALIEAPEKLRHSLRLLMQVSALHPPTLDAQQAACLEIAEWAQESGHPAAAVDFAEACAGLVSEDRMAEARKDKDTHTIVAAAWGAFVAARTNRIAGNTWRAEVFYSRAVRFSQWAGKAAKKGNPDRKRAWSIYVRAHLGYGRLHAKYTRFRSAERHYRAAAVRAYMAGEEWLSAQTCHDMLALSIEEGLLASVAGKARPDFAEARERGRLALARYPRHHERFPAAVHDYVFALVCEHRYSDAMPLLDLLMQAPIPMHDQVIGWSTLARTAGSLGDADRYADAEARVLELSPHYDLHTPSAYVNLAFGARGLGDLELAEQYVERGIAIAESRGIRLVVQVGRALLRELKAGDPGPPAAPRLEGHEAEELHELANAVADQLASWRGSTWTKKEAQFGLATLGAV